MATFHVEELHGLMNETAQQIRKWSQDVEREQDELLRDAAPEDEQGPRE